MVVVVVVVVRSRTAPQWWRGKVWATGGLRMADGGGWVVVGWVEGRGGSGHSTGTSQTARAGEREAGPAQTPRMRALARSSAARWMAGIGQTAQMDGRVRPGLGKPGKCDGLLALAAVVSGDPAGPACPACPACLPAMAALLATDGYLADQRG